ncbi:MAG TPA: hypothetical protein VGG25_25255 [Streptosporangiaceae bacterium]|jgi:hypothetical protein
MTGGPGGGTGPETPAGQGGLTGAGGGTDQGSPAGQHGAASARLRAFGAFWYDFLVGDDWLLAVAVLAGLALTWLLHRAGVAAWWLLPFAAAAALTLSIRRATRR